jgi:uroporphyrinogen-III synthase
VAAVPHAENAQGLLDALARFELGGRRVWIPSGSREGSASRTLPHALRSRGARVEVFAVYETVDLEPGADHLRALEDAVPGAIAYHSPSAADAAYAAASRPAVARWLRTAAAVAIGPATAQRLAGHDPPRLLECAEPGDDALVSALSTLDPLKPARSSR